MARHSEPGRSQTLSAQYTSLTPTGNTPKQLTAAAGAATLGRVAAAAWCRETKLARPGATLARSRIEVSHMASVLGFFNRPWSSLPLAEALDSIVATGTKYVGFLGSSRGVVLEWNTPWEEVEAMRALLGERGMQLRAVLAHVHFDVPEDEAIARYRALIDRATALDAGTLLEMGAHDPNHVEMYFRVMRAVCGYAQDHGLQIAVKPHGGITSTGKECAQVVERVGHDNYRLWWDPGNILYYKQLDPVAEARHVQGLVTGVCVKDCLIRPDGSPTVDVTPGEGQVDFEGVFRTLVEGGFKGGPCLIETLGPSDPQAATEAGKVALQFISRVMAAAGL